MNPKIKYCIVLLLLFKNLVSQETWDISKVDISKNVKIKIKPRKISNVVTYTTSLFVFYFDKSEIPVINYNLKRISENKSINLDSLMNSDLILINDTISFNKFARHFREQDILEIFVERILNNQVRIQSLKTGKNISFVKRLEWSKVVGNCLHSGFAIYIEDSYIYHNTTNWGRLLN